MGRNEDVHLKSHESCGAPLSVRIYYALVAIAPNYYPILAIVAFPVNVLTIVVLSRRKCGLSQGVTCYLLGMAAADLLVVFFDVILRKIPTAFSDAFAFLYYFRVCRTHAFLLYAITDCSIWFTVTFTFDRYVDICCQNLKKRYCTERTGTVVLGTVTVLSCLKNIFWFFMVQDTYTSNNVRWICVLRYDLLYTLSWAVIEVVRSALTTVIPFVLIVLFNALTIRHVLLASRARRRFRSPGNGESPSDPEMHSRRKSLVLLLVVSGNFILLWALYAVTAVWNRIMFVIRTNWVTLPIFFTELCYMLQLLSCCTNTALYAVTQTKFREQLKELMKSLVTVRLKWCQLCGKGKKSRWWPR